ncbi:MAG: hypothetical protein VB106_20090 [Clostridiaceae bacterium]|nr:hypothetical protein [Clostridiaceae bacterium]
MNEELRNYLRIEIIVAAAFNFFISGMVTGLIYHKADHIPTDTASIAVDLFITCLLTFTITAFFCRRSLKAAKTADILPLAGMWTRRLSRLFRRPLLFGILLGPAAAVILFALIAPIFALLHINALPFYPYVLLKSLSVMLLGGGVTLLSLYAGMCRPE